VAATAFYLVMRIRSLGGFQVATNPYGVISPAAFVFSVIWLFGKYVWKLIAPAPFNIFYMFYPARSLFEWRVLAGLVVLAAVSAAAWLLWRRGQALAFAFVILLLPLVPVMDMRAIGHNIFTERYLYLPMAGFCWLVAAALERLYSRRAALAVALLVLLAANYVLLTRSRNAEWHDNITLYTATLLVAPDANLIRGNLGEAYLEGAGRPDLALAEFRECVRRMPDRPEYYCKVGEALGELRRYNQALASLDRSLALWPNYPEAFLARGDVCREMGDEEAAERAYSRALEIKPGYSEAHVALGALRRAQGRLSEAEASFRLALKFTDIAAAHLNLGLLYLAQARYPEAEAAFRHVLVSEAHSVAAWDGLGKALAAQGKPSEAAACFRTALNERRWAHPRRLGRTPVPDQADLEQDLAATEHPKRI
jgi:tetratricopeptide (TPR) repeat protein